MSEESGVLRNPCCETHSQILFSHKFEKPKEVTKSRSLIVKFS